jgi:2'-5' RNA ligase
MARLFTAIELDPGVRETIVGRQTELARALDSANTGLRLVRPAQLHLTLVFLGEVEEARVPAIVRTMSADLPIAPFEIEFASCGVFPPRGPARVLWLGIDRGARQVTALFDAVSERLQQVGVPRETRPFSPHLTLGRWRDRGARIRSAALPDVGLVARQRVESVTLFHSRLLPQGPEHTPLAHARLSGPASPLN